MRVYDINPADRGLVAFEINASLGRRRAIHVVSRIEGARILRGRRPFAWLRDEVFCEFVLNEQLFNVWEPFGDNNRYWIGTNSGARTSALLLVRQAFVDYELPRFPWFRKLDATR